MTSSCSRPARLDSGLLTPHRPNSADSRSMTFSVGEVVRFAGSDSEVSEVGQRDGQTSYLIENGPSRVPMWIPEDILEAHQGPGATRLGVPRTNTERDRRRRLPPGSRRGARPRTCAGIRRRPPLLQGPPHPRALPVATPARGVRAAPRNAGHRMARSSRQRGLPADQPSTTRSCGTTTRRDTPQRSTSLRTPHPVRERASGVTGRTAAGEGRHIRWSRHGSAVRRRFGPPRRWCTTPTTSSTRQLGSGRISCRPVQPSRHLGRQPDPLGLVLFTEFTQDGSARHPARPALLLRRRLTALRSAGIRC